jgi:hypothetical protein
MVLEAIPDAAAPSNVIPGLVPGIQASSSSEAPRGAGLLHNATVDGAEPWIPATSVGMTVGGGANLSNSAAWRLAS